MATYPPVQNGLDMLEHRVDARIPVLEAVSDLLGGAHPLVDSGREIYLIYVASEDEVDQGLVLALEEVAQNRSMGAKLERIRVRAEMLHQSRESGTQWLFRGTVMISSNSGMPLSFAAGRVTR
jgi:hypothetical protein